MATHSSVSETKLDFASLTSADLRTSRGMQRVLDAIYDQGRGLPHHRKFIRSQAGALAATRSPVLSPEFEAPSSGYTTEADQSDDEECLLDVVPCYVLSLDENARPFQMTLGYWFGGGDLGRDPETAGVDILLPPVQENAWPISSATSTSGLVYPRHGYFAFDPKYGRLWLHARHKGIRVDDRPLAPRSKILLESRARISIGPYRFIFEFKVSDEKLFQEAKKQYLTQYRGEDNPYETTSATPSTHDIRIQDWILHGIVGASPVSVIYAASNVKSGQVVAVKRLHVRPTKSSAKEELDLYEAIRLSIRGHRYNRFVMRKHSVLTNDRPHVVEREVYLLWKPLARGDFAQFGVLGRWHKETQQVKKTLFVQVILALSALHDCGWIHRDLKPANLGVVQLGENPFAIIMDEGQALRQKRGGYAPRVAHCGTIGYLAPELESSAIASSYGKEADIWSMGAVSYFLFVAGRILWSTQYNMFVPERNSKDPTLSVFREVQVRLLRQPESTLEHLVGQMLDENPHQRPTIPAIVKHSALEGARQSIDARLDAEKEVGQKRGQDALH